MSEPHPTIRPQPGILDIALYQGGESKLAGHAPRPQALLEREPLRRPPRAVAAFRDAAATLHLYPTPTHARLRTAIADVHGLDAGRIVCGAGSDEIIAFLAQTYAGPGSEVIHTEHGFGMYRISALAAGATPVEVPEAERHTDVDAILAACSDRTALVFIANPNNPTGTMIAATEVARLAAGLPRAGAARPRRRLCRVRRRASTATPASSTRRDNVVMTRTFSKIHGLGGLRVGWGYGPAHVIDALNRVRGPFNLSTAALAAAEAAIRDTDYTARCRAENAANRATLAAALAAAGVPSDPSEANFILARFRDAGEARPPTRRCATAASSSAASPATTSPPPSASPSATPRAAPPSPRPSPPS